MQHRTFLAALLVALMACSDDPPPPPPDDTNDRFEGNVFGNPGEPVPDARVLLGSEPTYRRFDDSRAPAVAVTGPAGYYSFTRVRKTAYQPYDLSIRDDSLGAPLLTRFLGVTPTGTGISLPGKRPHKAWSSQLLPTVLNLPANASVFYIASGDVLDVRDDLVLEWNGGFQDDVTIRAIVYETDAATQLPRYLGYAVGKTRVTHGQPSAWQATFQPMPTSETQITLSPWANEPPPESVEATIYVDAGEGSNARAIGHLTSGSGRVTLPNFDGARYTLRAEQRGSTGRSRLFWRFAPTDAEVRLDFPPAPKFLDAPAPNATIERDATVRWQGDGLSRIRIDAGKAFRIETYTAAKEGPLLSPAVLDLLGLTIAPNTPIALTVTSFLAHQNIDDTVGAGFRDETEMSSDSPPLPLVIH